MHYFSPLSPENSEIQVCLSESPSSEFLGERVRVRGNLYANKARDQSCASVPARPSPLKHRRSKLLHMVAFRASMFLGRGGKEKVHLQRARARDRSLTYVSGYLNARNGVSTTPLSDLDRDVPLGIFHWTITT